MENKKAKTTANTTTAKTTKTESPMEKLTLKELSSKAKIMGMDKDLLMDAVLDGNKKPLIDFINTENAAYEKHMAEMEERAKSEKTFTDKLKSLSEQHGGTAWSEKLAQASFLSFLVREKALPESGARQKNTETLTPVLIELFGLKEADIKWPGNSVLLAAGAIAALRLVAEMVQDKETEKDTIKMLKDNRVFYPVKKMG